MIMLFFASRSFPVYCTLSIIYVQLYRNHSQRIIITHNNNFIIEQWHSVIDDDCMLEWHFPTSLQLSTAPLL